MNLHLRVLHGTLKRQDGASIGTDIAVHGKRFIIGSGPDCNMRCPSSTISEYHCEFVLEEGGIFLRDLRSENGTFLNGEQVTNKRPVAHGDHLRIGKLEFELAITPPAKDSVVPTPRPAAVTRAPRASDPVGDNISEILAAADEEERSRHRHDPASRQFVPPTESKPAAAPKEEKKKLVRPPKKPPGKLPPPPKVVADNTVNAAEEVLKKFFEKPKK